MTFDLYIPFSTVNRLKKIKRNYLQVDDLVWCKGERGKVTRNFNSGLYEIQTKNGSKHFLYADEVIFLGEEGEL